VWETPFAARDEDDIEAAIANITRLLAKVDDPQVAAELARERATLRAELQAIRNDAERADGAYERRLMPALADGHRLPSGARIGIAGLGFLVRLSRGMEYPRLPNAPITEALIDLRIDPPFESPDVLAPVRERLKDEFPETRNIIQVQGTLSVSSDQSASVPPSSVQRRDYGYAMWTADQRRVVQVRTDGFSFSHLKPYGDWAALRADARKAWERFATQASVVRCAVRYVNRIELALPFAKFEDFF
jgi:hypothetical protein